MPKPSMMTKVPSIAARISGSRRISRTPSFSALLTPRSLRAGRSANRPEGLRPTLPVRFDAHMPDASSGAVAATNLATPMVDGGPALETPDAAVAWSDGVITYVGPATGLSGVEPEWFEACTIAPGFVDCHTHLPFVGWRADEFEARLSGLSYRDLHGEGGIYRSARMFAEASDDEVLAFCRPLVREMAQHGTTTLELKTGYGLSVEGELRQARLARRLAEDAPQTCTVTLLACHAVPGGMERSAWVRVACAELIPAAAAEGLADAVDVYVEDIAFSLEDLASVAEAASAAGLPLRCHADQLGPSGAAEAAVALGARSADHLNHVSAGGVVALGAARGTVAVLLPTLDPVPALVATRRACAARYRRGRRDRERLQPGHLARGLDARGDRDGLLALRALPPGGAASRDGERRHRARARPRARYPGPGQARRPRRRRGRCLPAGAIPARTQPGPADVRGREEGRGTMRKLPVLVFALVAAVLLPVPASAQTSTTLTLSASAGTIDFGDRVRLSGTSSAALAGATVEIVDEAGTVVASDAMNADGAFEATISPDGTDRYRARLGDATSEAVTVQVRAVVSVRMSPVRLFDVVIVRGTVAPARPGRRVHVALTNGGRTVERRTVTIRADGVYRATFPIDRVGHHRAMASFAAADLVRAKAKTDADAAPLPNLSAGDHGVFVGLLERRLVELHYRLASAKDRSFDFRTGDAVVAFHKVQGMERVFVGPRGDVAALGATPHPPSAARLERLPLRGRSDAAGPVHRGGRRDHERAARLDRCRRGDARRHVPRPSQARGVLAEPPLLSELLRRPPSAARLDRGADLCREPRVRPDPVLEREVGVRARGLRHARRDLPLRSAARAAHDRPRR